MQIFLIFQESKLVLYLYDRNCLYRSWAKYGLYKYILVILPSHCRKIKIDFWLSIRAMFFMVVYAMEPIKIICCHKFLFSDFSNVPFNLIRTCLNRLHLYPSDRYLWNQRDRFRELVLLYLESTGWRFVLSTNVLCFVLYKDWDIT